MQKSYIYILIHNFVLLLIFVILSMILAFIIIKSKCLCFGTLSLFIIFQIYICIRFLALFFSIISIFTYILYLDFFFSAFFRFLLFLSCVYVCLMLWIILWRIYYMISSIIYIFYNSINANSPLLFVITCYIIILFVNLMRTDINNAL